MKLETERLSLRPFMVSDLESLHAILSDPLTMRFWPQPFSREETQGWIARNLRRYEELGFGRLAVILKETGELIGDCGIVPLEIDGTLENDLGYIVHHPYQGHGYATEAANACKAYGFDDLGLKRICANMPADHFASRRVAEHLGMRLEKEFHNSRNRSILTCLYAASRRSGE